MKIAFIERIKERPTRLYKNWIVHNIFAHPLMQFFMILGLEKLASIVHDSTLPALDDE